MNNIIFRWYNIYSLALSSDACVLASIASISQCFVFFRVNRSGRGPYWDLFKKNKNSKSTKKINVWFISMKALGSASTGTSNSLPLI